MEDNRAAADMERCLDALGVRPGLLPASQREELDQRGYVVLGRLLDDEWLTLLRQHFEELIAAEGDQAGLEAHQEEGARRLGNLIDKGEVFDGIWTHPLLLAAIHQVIARPFKLSSLNGRDALPGAGHQALHADWRKGRAAGDPYHVCNSIWLLDDFTPENGSTRLVPGSHRRRHPDEVLVDSRAPHPDEVHLHAPAGTVAVFNSHTWHGGTENRSTNLSRRALHCYFVAREHPAQTEPAERLSVGTRARLSPAQRYLLDVD